MTVQRWREWSEAEDLLSEESPGAIPLSVARPKRPVDELYVVLRDQAIEANGRVTVLTEKLDRLKERHQEDQAKIGALQSRIATLEAMLKADRAILESASQRCEKIGTALTNDRVVVVESYKRLVLFGGRHAVVSDHALRALLAVLGTSGLNSSAVLERIAGLPVNQCPGSNWRGQWVKLRYMLGRAGINVDEMVRVQHRGNKKPSGYEALVALEVRE